MNDAENGGECLACRHSELEHLLEVLPAEPAFLEIALRLGDDCIDGRARERPVCPRIQICVALENRELRARLLVRHPTVSSTGE